LFPDGSFETVDWLPTLVGMIETWLAENEAARPARAAEIPELIKKEQQKILGWTESLSNSSLSAPVRGILEEEMNKAIAAVNLLKDEARREAAMAEQLRKLVDPNAVIECLHNLETVLAGSNINSINIELARHIDRIDCHGDGRVVLLGTNLGVLEGAIELISRNSHTTVAAQEPADNAAVGKVVPRRRSTRRTDTLTGADKINVHEAFRSVDPTRFAGLPPAFMWAESFVIGKKPSWAAENAQRVLEKRRESPDLSLGQLGEHFGKTRPTISEALRIANGHAPKMGVRGDGEGKVPREPDHRDLGELAKMARKLYDDGKMNTEIQAELNVPKNKLHELLAKTFTEAGEVMPDGRGRRANLQVKQVNPPKYKRMADQVHMLEAAGLSCKEIGARLNIDPTTLTKIRRFWAENHGVAFLDGRTRRKDLPHA
jgi:hypothetical protein